MKIINELRRQYFISPNIKDEDVIQEVAKIEEALQAVADVDQFIDNQEMFQEQNSQEQEEGHLPIVAHILTFLKWVNFTMLFLFSIIWLIPLIPYISYSSFTSIGIVIESFIDRFIELIVFVPLIVASTVISNMKYHPNIRIYHTILGTFIILICVYGSLSIDQSDAGDFLIISSMYIGAVIVLITGLPMLVDRKRFKEKYLVQYTKRV